MNSAFKEKILQKLNAKDLKKSKHIQDLWSGYGSLDRYEVKDGKQKSIIIKTVKPPLLTSRNISHKRKLFSYKVEFCWYENWANRCNNKCYIPESYVLEQNKNTFLFALEDLKESGFPIIKNSVSISELKTCLKWLAYFHSTFLQVKPESLWKTGTYWHLETRPDELSALKDKNLKHAAKAIDQKLKDSSFQTLVHGDAKIANFCFSKCGKKAAAVDFQYVGGGCGMKDVAYLIGSGLSESECQKHEKELLDFYFSALKDSLKQKLNSNEVESLENDWRTMFIFAWADFHRFLKGWSPDHWKINSYSEEMCEQAINLL